MSIATTDPIADMLSRLKTAVAMNKSSVVLPSSKLKFHLAQILKEQGYVTDVKLTQDDKPQLTLTIGDKSRPLRGLRKVSKPGLRVFVKSQDIPTVRQGLGIAIVSTPQGLMAGHRAKARKLGGELICEVW